MAFKPELLLVTLQRFGVMFVEGCRCMIKQDLKMRNVGAFVYQNILRICSSSLVCLFMNNDYIMYAYN